MSIVGTCAADGGVREVLAVLAAAGVRRVRRGDEGQRAAYAGAAHLRDRIGEHRAPSCGCPSTRGRSTPWASKSAGMASTQAAVLLVDGAHPTEVLVVLADLSEPLVGDAPAARDVAQERQDVIGPLGTAEGHEQQGVVRRSHRRSSQSLEVPALRRAS